MKYSELKGIDRVGFDKTLLECMNDNLSIGAFRIFLRVIEEGNFQDMMNGGEWE